MISRWIKVKGPLSLDDLDDQALQPLIEGERMT
jgi:hypothetical protein